MEYVGYGDGSDEVVIRGDLDVREFIALWSAMAGAHRSDERQRVGRSTT